MIKLQWKLFCIALVIMIIGGVAQVNATTLTSMSLGDGIGKPGDTVSVDLTIKDLTSKGIASGIINIDYDNKKIKFNKLVAGDIITNKTSDLSQNELGTGLKIMYSDFDQTGSSFISKDGTICTIMFDIDKTCSDGDIQLKLSSDTKFYDKDIKVVENPIMKSGKIKVKSKIDKIVLKLDDPKMKINDVDKEIDPGIGTKPYSRDGRTFVPIRAIIEEMGGTVAWDKNDQRVDVVLSGTTIKLWINKANSTVNDKEKVLDVVPHINNGRTMLPLRFVTENLGCKVDWDGKTKMITISY